MAGARPPRGDRKAAHLGDVSQVCLIASDFMKSVEGLVRLGIGPWRLMTLGPHNVTDQLYRGQPATSEIRVGLARCGRTEWEVITPISGPSIHADWLAARWGRCAPRGHEVRWCLVRGTPDPARASDATVAT